MKKEYSIMIKEFKKKSAVSILVLAFMASINLNAQTWTGTTNTDFETATNWDSGVVPGVTNTIVIASVANNPIIASTANSTITTLSINASATLNVKGSLTPSAVTYTGGNIIIDGGVLNVRRNFNLGVLNNPATITVNSGTLNARSALIIGEKGACVLNIYGGEASVDQNSNGQAIIIGGYYSSGIVNLNGGILRTNPLKLGINALSIVETPKDAVNASGYLNIDGGTLILTNDQTTFINGYVTANKIRTVSGKKIVVSYDSATNLTTVTATANLGIDSKISDNTFSVYPNPSNGVINIDTKNNNWGNLKVSVYNLLGQQILTSELEGNNLGNYSLEATNKLTAGTYILNIKSSSFSNNSKILIK